MAVKKVLVALGLVCVVAPAALAASMMMNRGGGGPLDQPAQGVVEAILASLTEMMEGSRDVGAGKIPQGAGPGIGVGTLPIRMVDVLVPNLDYLKDLNFGGDGALAGVIATSSPGGAAGATGGAVATQASGARQTGSPGAPFFAAGGGSGRGVGGGFGIGGIGGGGGSGSGGSGGGATDLALAVDMAEPPANVDAAPGETIAAMPLPASVWMLMASMVGLAFIGFRRRSSS